MLGGQTDRQTDRQTGHDKIDNDNAMTTTDRELGHDKKDKDNAMTTTNKWPSQRYCIRKLGTDVRDQRPGLYTDPIRECRAVGREPGAGGRGPGVEGGGRADGIWRIGSERRGVYEIDGERAGLRSGHCGNKYIFPSRLVPQGAWWTRLRRTTGPRGSFSHNAGAGVRNVVQV